MQIKSLQDVETTQTSSRSLEDQGDRSLLSSLLYDMKHTPHLAKWSLKVKGWERDTSHNSPMVLFIVKTKRLKCSCGLKWKLHLMKGSLVWLPLHRTRRHQTNHLSLHFHVTSMMMPRAQPVVTPPPVLRQNWETLARLTSLQSKPPNVDACPHTVFIHSSILRRKPANLLLLGFEAKTKKSSRWF
jgi:hypothetical protein